MQLWTFGKAQSWLENDIEKEEFSELIFETIVTDLFI